MVTAKIKKVSESHENLKCEISEERLQHLIKNRHKYIFSWEASVEDFIPLAVCDVVTRVWIMRHKFYGKKVVDLTGGDTGFFAVQISLLDDESAQRIMDAS